MLFFRAGDEKSSESDSRELGRGSGTRRARAARAATVLLALMLTACPGPSKTPAGGNKEAMSRSEADIANDLWRRQNRPREALEHALEATRLDKTNEDAAHLTALLYLYFCAASRAECQLPAAEQHARQALKIRSDFREARNTLGVILIHQKRYADAVAVLEPLAADMLYTTPENAWGNLGWAYLEQGRLEKAIDALRRSVAAQPMFCVGHFRLGIAYERKKMLEAALDALGRALETDDPACRNLQDAWAARGRVFAKLGRADAARADFSRCVDLDSKTDAGKECGSMLRKLE